MVWKTLLSKSSFRNNILNFNFKNLRYSYNINEKHSKKYSNAHDNYINIKISLCGLVLSGIFYYKIKSKLLQSNTVHANCISNQYTAEEVSKHKTRETGVWVTYQNVVYDITDFIDKHPGGDKINMAAGGAVEPFWSLYAIHKNNKEVMDILDQHKIGILIPDSSTKTVYNFDDPYAMDPERHPALQVVSNKPFNAEAPPELLTDSFITPNDLFFVRNHLPVPHVDIKKFKLTFDGIGVDKVINLTIGEVKKIAKVNSIESTIMCSGNRRKDMFNHKPVRGLAWHHGAISTAKWTGIKLVDLFSKYNLTHERLVKMGAKHVQFEGLDTDQGGARYGASIPIEIALDPNSDVLLAWNMNDEELPMDHGYPLRLIIPGIIGARQVKWLTKIVISDKESDSFWQQNDYKTFSPNIDFDRLDYSTMPPIMEANVQSAICVPRDGQCIRNEGSVTVKGYAWSGAGRGIIRVEVSTDGGETWLPATITHSKDAPTSSHINRKQWAWIFWELDIPIKDDCRELEILCKAVDSSQNSQPESFKGIWNVRGLMANAFHRIKISLHDDA